METTMLLRAITAAVVFFFSVECQGKPKGTPNIVIIIGDALGYNDVGLRNPKFVTPVIDALSKEGIRLDNYYVEAFATGFRASLMTGKYFPNTGSMAFIQNAVDNCIPHDELNLAERLQRAGYSTSFLGKWQMGYSRTSCLPKNRGFDYFYGSLMGWRGSYFEHTKAVCVKRGNETTEGKKCCYERAADIRDCLKSCQSKAYVLRGLDFWENDEPVLDAGGQFGTDLITSKAIERIEKHNDDKPLFLTVAYETRKPNNPPDEYKNKITDIPDGKLGPLKSPRKDFAAMLNAVDTGLGRIIQKLKDEDLWENTVLLFTPDKGGNKNVQNNWPLRGAGMNYFEGRIRGLGILAGGAVTGDEEDGDEGEDEDLPEPYTGLIHMTDWYKTFLTLAGAEIGNSGADSYDIWNSIRLSKPSPRTEILHSLNPEIPRLGRPLYPNTFDSSIQAAIRIEKYKLLTGRIYYNGAYGGWVAPAEYPELVTVEPDLNDTSNVHLYNIKDDPEEKNDLSAEMPNKVKEMLDRLHELQPMTKPEPYSCPEPAGAPVLVSEGDTDSAEDDVYVWKPWIIDTK